jgi:hypothetical protein
MVRTNFRVEDQISSQIDESIKGEERYKILHDEEIAFNMLYGEFYRSYHTVLIEFDTGTKTANVLKRDVQEKLPL